MGKISAGLLGGFSGKVGTMVGAIVKGQATVRAYQKYVTNPKSARQMQVRDQFKRVNEFVRHNFDLVYRKVNMLGYGRTGNFQFIVGEFAKRYDFMRLNPLQITLSEMPWIRKTISSGVTFREDLFSDWDLLTDTAHPLPVGVTAPIGTPKKYYFGSDVPLEGTIVFAYFDAYEDMAQEPTLQMRQDGYKIIPSTANETGLPQVGGWHLAKADAGTWNYIYSVDFGKNFLIEIYNMGASSLEINVNVGVAGLHPMDSGNLRFPLA